MFLLIKQNSIIKLNIIINEGIIENHALTVWKKNNYESSFSKNKEAVSNTTINPMEGWIWLRMNVSDMLVNRTTTKNGS